MNSIGFFVLCPPRPFANRSKEVSYDPIFKGHVTLMWLTCNWKYIVNCKANTSCNPCNTCNIYYIKLYKTLICVLHVLHVLHGTITGRMASFQVLHVCYMSVTCDQQRIIIISEIKKTEKNSFSFYIIFRCTSYITLCHSYTHFRL